MMPHRLNEIYLRALRSPSLVRSLSTMVGGTPVGLQTEFFYCRPGTPGFSLHQDNFYAESPYGAYASAWCPMTHITPEKGGLIVYPGSHKEGILPTRKVNAEKDAGQDPNANNEECIVPPQYQPLVPEVPKGAALYIHGSLVHGSNRNATQEWRPVLLMTYLREGETFRPGRYAQRSPIPVAGLAEEIIPPSTRPLAETA
jgi:ectoine hydroxylase-related dioxygenase (phytanoyl-CoA dioxygenase family)